MPRKIMLIVSGVIIAALLLLVGGYAMTGARTSDQVPAHVSAAGIDLAGLTGPEVEARLLSYEDSLAGTPAAFLVEGTEVILDPATVGLDIAEDEIAEAALAAGTQRSFFSGFLVWLGLSDAEINVPVPVSVDDAAIDQQLNAWESELLTGGEMEAAVAIRAGRPTAVYASPVTRFQRPSAAEVVETVLADPARPVVALETATVPSPITNEMVDEVVAEAEQLLAGPITLTSSSPEATITLTEAQLVGAFGTATTTEPASIAIILSEEVLDDLFFPVREQFPGSFQNAEFIINDDDTVSIQPGVSGPKVASSEAAVEILAAASTPGRTGALPLEDGAEPDITTADLEALGVNHLVSRFTTYHDCCANRVTNIQLIADTIDGVIVMPGETFGINDFVGERTTAKGYLPAGTIINGEIVDTVGGGVSQFATTFYNAVFWGGYTDITHKPHSYYFSRYPEGIEATINWPNVELEFRNDTDNAILIKPTYTDTSITVSFYSENAGSAIAGDQNGGTTRTWTELEGDGVVVSGSVSGRYDYRSPQTQYDTDRSMTPGTQSVVQGGREGWSVTVTRLKTFPDGTSEEETWVARYLAQPRIVRVHPCSVPGSSEACPVPSTTTLVPETTVPGTAPPTTAPPTTTAPPATTVPPTTAPPATTTTTAPPTTTTTQPPS